MHRLGKTRETAPSFDPEGGAVENLWIMKKE